MVEPLDRNCLRWVLSEVTAALVDALVTAALVVAEVTAALVVALVTAALVVAQVTAALVVAQVMTRFRMLSQRHGLCFLAETSSCLVQAASLLLQRRFGE